jgi:hypothetical protein
MPTVQIPWPVSTSKDVPQRAGSGQQINVFMEQMSDGRVIRKRAPGLTQFSASQSGAVHCRGLIPANDGQLLAVFNEFCELVDANGTMTALGPISGSDIVTLARNKHTPIPDIVCATQTGTFTLSTGAPPAPYPDADIGLPNSVCFGDGYFFFTYGSGVCTASGINSTSINLLDTIIVNSSSSTLLRGVYFAQTLFLFTETTIEAWTNTANPVGFPFSRSAVIPRGLMNYAAVAGYESGFAATLMFVGNDNIVYQMNGYAPVRVSTSDIERRISNVAAKTTLRACVYMSEGHAVWQLTCSDFTLCYDLTGSVWTERDSEGQLYSRIESSVFFDGKWIVGDYSTGILGAVDANNYSEYGNRLTWVVQSLPADKFPQRAVVARADFNFVMGVGLTPSETPYNELTDPYALPQVLISWSDDGGASFKMPVQRGLGSVGQNEAVATILRSGQASRFGRVWRLEVSDPVYVGLLAGAMEAR